MPSLDDYFWPNPLISRGAFAEAVENATKVKALLDPHMDEIRAGAVVLDRLQRYACDVNMEWLVPESYGWGESAESGGQLIGIPLRIVADIDRLYLAHKVKP